MKTAKDVLRLSRALGLRNKRDWEFVALQNPAAAKQKILAYTSIEPKIPRRRGRGLLGAYDKYRLDNPIDAAGYAKQAEGIFFT
jgi:hypothetical protein